MNEYRQYTEDCVRQIVQDMGPVEIKHEVSEHCKRRVVQARRTTWLFPSFFDFWFDANHVHFFARFGREKQIETDLLADYMIDILCVRWGIRRFSRTTINR